MLRVLKERIDSIDFLLGLSMECVAFKCENCPHSKKLYDKTFQERIKILDECSDEQLEKYIEHYDKYCKVLLR